jgi:cephalosporin-C deacetylase-like acetyl esterase
MRKIIYWALLPVLFLLAFNIQATAQTTPQGQVVLTVDIVDSDYIFLQSNPIDITVNLANVTGTAANGKLVVKLSTDDHEPLKADSLLVSLPANESRQYSFGLDKPAPGFYRYNVQFYSDNTLLMDKKFNVGVEPEKISSPIDAKADFKAFWDNSLKELAMVAPQYELTLIPEQSQLDYNTYLVKMRSFGNEPIQGYYTQPKREGKHPVIVEYMGYGSQPYFPNQHWDGFARFVLSIRGQALNQPGNRFGTWITYGLDSKEDYYYRGAFLDVVRALDFVCSRPEIDGDKIGVRGGSQGGALSFVAASLDQRVKAAAPEIPFLSDYRDYFAITHWPREDFERYIAGNNLPQSEWERIYNLLSYFDVKNLAQWITSPVLMGIGVQDDVCPLHTNFAVYNQVKSEKQWLAYPQNGHNTGFEHYGIVMQFFKDKLNVK